MLRNYSDLTPKDESDIILHIINNPKQTYKNMGAELNVEPRVLSRIAMSVGIRRQKENTRNITSRKKVKYRPQKSYLKMVNDKQIINSQDEINNSSCKKANKLLEPLHLTSVQKIKDRLERIKKIFL